jgi:DNA-binding XRE family transcriptional regulator
MKKLKRWEDVKRAKLSPEKLKEIDARVERKVAALRLAEVRKARGLTQAQLAKRLRVSQGHLSQTEGREEVMLSTVRRYVEAMGGKLKVEAVFDDKTIPVL